MINPELILNPYKRLFATKLTPILFVQPDRPHYQNLLLKLLSLIPAGMLSALFTVLPLYPFLLFIIVYSGDIGNALTGSMGQLNRSWIFIVYAFYVYYMTFSVSQMNTVSMEQASWGVIYSGLFHILPIFVIYGTWWFAMPWSPHDIFVEIQNQINSVTAYDSYSIPQLWMRSPVEIQERIQSCKGQTGGGYNVSFGLSDWIMWSLLGIVVLGIGLGLFTRWFRSKIKESFDDRNNKK